jgi:hypothetical protein
MSIQGAEVMEQYKEFVALMTMLESSWNRCGILFSVETFLTKIVNACTSFAMR